MPNVPRVHVRTAHQVLRAQLLRPPLPPGPPCWMAVAIIGLMFAWLATVASVLVPPADDVVDFHTCWVDPIDLIHFLLAQVHPHGRFGDAGCEHVWDMARDAAVFLLGAVVGPLGIVALLMSRAGPPPRSSRTVRAALVVWVLVVLHSAAVCLVWFRTTRLFLAMHRPWSWHVP